MARAGTPPLLDLALPNGARAPVDSGRPPDDKPSSMGGAPAELPSLGGSIALSFLSLGLVCLLAYVALNGSPGAG